MPLYHVSDKERGLLKICKLAGLTLLLFVCFQGYAESSSFENKEFIWLEYGEKVNETNGSATQTVNIKSSTDSLPIAEIHALTAFYCDRWQTGEKQYYTIPIEQKEGLYFLRVNTSSRFYYQIYVTGSRQGEHFTAQIAFPLYADGIDKNMKKEQVLLDKPEKFPDIEFRSAGNTARPQTGQTFQLLYKPVNLSNDSVKEIRIIDLNNKSAEQLTPDAAGMFSITPPHDQRLDSGGYDAYKETIVYAEEVVANEVYKTSLNLILRRSSSAHRNLSQGIVFFFFAMMLILAIVLFRRRSFMY